MLPGVQRHVVGAWVARQLNADGRPVSLVAETAGMSTQRLTAVLDGRVDVTVAELVALGDTLDGDAAAVVATIAGVRA